MPSTQICVNLSMKMSRKSLWKVLAPVSTVLRVLAPFLVFSYPILTIVMVILLDTADGNFYLQWNIKRTLYNTIDKSLDLLWYTVSVYYAYLNLPYFQLLLALYLLRLAGHLVFYFSKNEKIFLYFPNFYENVLIFIVVATAIPKFSSFLVIPVFYYVVLILGILKMIQELLVHTRKYLAFVNSYLPEWMWGPERK